MLCDLFKKEMLRIFLFNFEYRTNVELTSKVYLNENILKPT
jgi:hypothetical protein